MFQASISITSVKGCRPKGTHWPQPLPALICSSSSLRLRWARLPWRRASRSSVAGGSLTPVKCSSTALASATGILLASNAAISCTEGEALPVASKPKASSAGKRHALQPPAPATATPNPHRPEPARIGSFLSGTEPVQFIAPNRANRRTPIGFLLRRFFQKLSLQIAHRLVAVGDAPVQTGHQTLQPVQDRLVKRLVTAVGLRNQFQAAVPQALNFTTSPKIKPLKNETRLPRPESCLKIAFGSHPCLSVFICG